MEFKPISDRSDRRCEKSDRRNAILLKNHAKLTYFHLIFPSFQCYAALILLIKSEVIYRYLPCDNVVVEYRLSHHMR